MDEPKLIFNETPFPADEIERMAQEFRELTR
jgi:HAMP domain-containing protein